MLLSFLIPLLVFAKGIPSEEVGRMPNAAITLIGHQKQMPDENDPSIDLFLNE